MKNASLIAVATCLLVVVGVFVSTALAQDKAEPVPDWSKLKVLTYATGLTGFFDPDTGKLYIYDSNLDNCVIIRQLTTLGEPMKKLKI